MLDEEQIRASYLRWRYWNFNREIDEIDEFLSIDSYRKGWIRQTRMALQLSGKSVAQRLTISASALCQLEKAEASGCITIKKLERAAKAMECELIYGFRHRSRVKFSQVIWGKLLGVAMVHPAYTLPKPVYRQIPTLATIARNTFRDAKFRRKLGWSQRGRPPRRRT